MRRRGDRAAAGATTTGSTAAGATTESRATADGPGMPVELSIDLVEASHAPDAPGLGRGFLFLLVLAIAGLVAGLLAGWATRYWVATWREN